MKRKIITHYCVKTAVVFVFAAVVSPGVSLGQTSEFSETQFATWSNVATFTNSNGATTGKQLLTDGVPVPGYQSRIYTGESTEGVSAGAWGIHTGPETTYCNRGLGRIRSVSWRLDERYAGGYFPCRSSPKLTGTANSLIIIQDDRYYYADYHFTYDVCAWSSHFRMSICASDFQPVRFQGPGPQVPDFSRNAPLITFGIALEQNTGAGPAGPGYDAVGYIDNWQVVVTSCPGDFDEDGTVGSPDFFAFLPAFFEGLIAADVNCDGVVNSQDFFDFIRYFFEICS